MRVGQSRIAGAGVGVTRVDDERAQLRALVVNAGNANAGTGEAGWPPRAPTCVAVARLLDCAPEQVLPFSTGVIMEPLPVERIVDGLPPRMRAVARRRLVHRRAARS